MATGSALSELTKGRKLGLGEKVLAEGPGQYIGGIPSERLYTAGRFVQSNPLLEFLGGMSGRVAEKLGSGQDVGYGESVMAALEAPGKLAKPVLPLAAGIVGAADPALDLLRRGLSKFTRRPQKSLMLGDAVTLPSSPSGVAPGSAVTLQHYGPGAATDQLLAGKYGTRGSAMGAGGEYSRLSGPEAEDVRQRVYGYRAGQKPETHIASGQPSTEVTVPGLYDLEADPENIRKTIKEYLGEANKENIYSYGPAREDVVKSMVERELKARGYRGYHTTDPQIGGVGVVFEDIDLRRAGLDTEQSAKQIREALGSGPLRVDEAQLGVSSGVGGGIGEGALSRGKTGQYTGLPAGVNTPGKLGGLTRKFADAARRGQEAMAWYDRDAQALNRMVSGDVNKQLDLASGLSVTSPQMTVPGNAAEGLRAQYQNLTGRPIQAGRYPGEQGATLEAAFADPLVPLGRKRATFRSGLMGEYTPEAPQGATMDMWMARLAGFGKDTLGPRQYQSLENITGRATDILNRERGPLEPVWNPHRAQAAAWTDIKARTEGKEIAGAGGNFGDAFEGMRALQPTETVPGAAIDPGSVLAEPGVKQLFYDDVLRMMKDPYGNNVIDQHIGLSSFPTFRGQGVWSETVDGNTVVQYNPNMVDQPVVPEIGGRRVNHQMEALGLGETRVKSEIDPETGRVKEYEVFEPRKGLSREESYLKHRLAAQVDESARDLLDASAIAKGITLRQQGSTWVRPIDKPGAPKYTKNALRVDVPYMDKSELTRIAKDLEGMKAEFGIPDWEPIPIVPTEQGFLVYRPVTEELSRAGAADSLAGIDRFQKMLTKYLDERTPKWRDYGYRPEAKWMQADSSYFEANQQPWAQGYAERLDRLPDQVRDRVNTAIETVQPHIQQHRRWYEDKYR